jgi:hypothetical protein
MLEDNMTPLTESGSATNNGKGRIIINMFSKSNAKLSFINFVFLLIFRALMENSETHYIVDDSFVELSSY